MTILSEFYASATPDTAVHVIELACDAWAEPVVICSDYVDHEIVTEDARTLLAVATAMGVSLPKRNNSATQNLTFALDNVRGEVSQRLRAAQTQQAEVRLIYRAYFASDFTYPADGPLTLVVRSVTARGVHVEITAGLFDLMDYRWPREVYNSLNAPGLRYIQS